MMTVGAYTGQGSLTTPVMVAISQSSNPAGSYYLYQISSCGSSLTGDADQPRLGVNSNYVAVSVPCPAGYPSLTILDKTMVESGGALALNSTFWQFVDNVNTGGANRDQPVITYGSTNSNRLYLVASGITSGNASTLYSWVDGSGATPVFYGGAYQVNGQVRWVPRLRCHWCRTRRTTLQ